MEDYEDPDSGEMIDDDNAFTENLYTWIENLEDGYNLIVYCINAVHLKEEYYKQDILSQLEMVY